jgi:hypothetical protein
MGVSVNVGNSAWELLPAPTQHGMGKKRLCSGIPIGETRKHGKHKSFSNQDFWRFKSTVFGRK